MLLIISVLHLFSKQIDNKNHTRSYFKSATTSKSITQGKYLFID